jgi:hypothetical protein
MKRAVFRAVVLPYADILHALAPTISPNGQLELPGFSLYLQALPLAMLHQQRQTRYSISLDAPKNDCYL